jgi:hypothetical protein
MDLFVEPVRRLHQQLLTQGQGRLRPLPKIDQPSELELIWPFSTQGETRMAEITIKYFQIYYS